MEMSRDARAFVVLPERGDLYLITFKDKPAQFVQLTEGGIVDDPRKVIDTAIRVLCDSNGKVIGLPDQSTGEFIACQPMNVKLPGTL